MIREVIKVCVSLYLMIYLKYVYFFISYSFYLLQFHNPPTIELLKQDLEVWRLFN